MYYYLGIVEKKNLIRGKIVPTYVLFSSKKENAETRSGLCVINLNMHSTISQSLIVVNSISGNDYLVDFLSRYRTNKSINRRHAKKRKFRKVYPVGALFWFECTKSGKPTGKALFIKHVPDKSITAVDGGFTRMKENLNRPKPRMSERMCNEPNTLELSGVKPKLYQSNLNKGRRKNEELVQGAQRNRREQTDRKEERVKLSSVGMGVDRT